MNTLFYGARKEIIMLDELIKEVHDLKEYKLKYEYVIKDKERMSDLLFELMTEKYNNSSYADRKEYFRKNSCRCCRYEVCCDLEVPQDIGKPIKSDKAWIPAIKSCENFEWD
jgi:hypothetical protein